VSKWQNEMAERNRQSLARLTRALPHIFPSVVLSHALSGPFVPPTPHVAIDSYWRAHPLRGDRLARSLAAGPEHPAAGRGGSVTAARTDCPPPSERRPRLIANGHSLGFRFLLCVRPAGLRLRLACLGRGHQRECELALRLRDCVAVLECAERPSPAAAAPASATVWPDRRAAMEERPG
jgi:hypothetical protein